MGTVATVGLKFITDVGGWRKVLTLLLPAALAGVAVVFVDKFKYSPALGCYPLGLLVGLLWAFSERAVANINSSSRQLVRLGYAHLTAATLFSIFAGAFVVIPAILQIRDELGRPLGDTLAEYKREQLRAGDAKTGSVVVPAPTTAPVAATRPASSIGLAR